MILATFTSILPELKPYLRSKLKNLQLEISNKPLDLDKVNPDTEILGVFVDSKVDMAVFEKLPKLKLIVTCSTGYDHIDLQVAKKRKVVVCNVPTYGENTVAQHALTLMLALSRKLFESVKRVKEGVYDYHGLVGFDLKGKTIGIVGTGHIGIHVIDMLQGFEARIIAHDPCATKELAKTHNFELVSWSTLLKESDIISLHVPLCDDTHYMINKSTIKKMKQGVYIINTARGGLVDAQALVEGLESGKVAGAGLDVLEQEAYLMHTQKITSKTSATEIETSLMENILIDHPHTIVTPHNAFNSVEALRRIMDTSIENVKMFLEAETKNQIILKNNF
ncbi:MAG: hydroxyacid dehydrogenase [Candidatus Magasanikbacteria bacterium]|nr:hydroxyacid dehydrogenase [Candidatus Magasanikbacteria bacterium]